MEQLWETSKIEQNTPTVLVIEDRPEIQRVVEALLQFTGYNGIYVDTWKQGLDIYKEKEPDLVLLDISLPDIQWPEVLSQLLVINNKVKVIIATWEILDEQQKQTLLWAKWFLYKPFDLGLFTSTLKSVIESKD